MELKKGFYPALGTPLDENGNLVVESYRKQINLMINAGAAGALCMGSMGSEAALTDETYALTAKTAAETANGQIPLFIGAMDNSVFRVKDRCEMLKGLNFEGIVLTTPFYGTTSPTNLIRFFTEIADIAPKPIYLYDLPVVTKQKITYDMVLELCKHPNIKGIKTGDIVLARLLQPNVPECNVLFSNLDIFDVAGAFGLPRVLDGMFTCVPANSAAFQKCYIENDINGITNALNNILALRDLFVEEGIWAGYTVAMNLLGLDGIYSHGYTPLATEEHAKKVTELMKQIGEI